MSKSCSYPKAISRNCTNDGEGCIDRCDCRVLRKVFNVVNGNRRVAIGRFRV